MWCPDGFVLLSEINNVCFDLSADYTAGLFSVQSVEKIEELPDRQENASAMWLFLTFVEKNEGNFYAALPNGSVVRLSDSVTEPYFPIDETCPMSTKRIDAFLHHAFDPFAFVNNESFTIDLDTDPARTERLGHYWGRTILRPLNGFPICWKLPSSSLDLSEIILSLTTIEPQNNQSPNPKGGRKKVRDKAAEEFWQTYPQGYDEVSLSAAARRLGYDRKTLREGLKELEESGRISGE